MPRPGQSTTARIRCCDRFLNWLVLAYHLLLERGELLRAWDALGPVQRQLTWMARLAEDSTGHWLTPSRAAERELSPATLAGLAAAPSGADEAGTARGGIDGGAAAGAPRHWEAIAARYGDGPVPRELFDELEAVLG